MRIVAALGGNALLERSEKPDAAIQRRHVRSAADSLAPLAAEHQLIVCHGNGPQVGQLALETEADQDLSEPYPLDVLVAQTQGMIGYWLAQELRDAGVARPVTALITQTVVDGADPAFRRPTKFIGRTYAEGEGRELAAQRNWIVARDGTGWRRVVPSPRPVRLVERDAVLRLLESGAVVICGGGGGIPVIESGDVLIGVEAVIDKDRTAAMMAIDLAADRFLVLTDVPAVMSGFGTAEEAPLAQLTLDEIAASTFPDGSMGPKIEACATFVRSTGNPAAIGALSDAAAILDGIAGTTITANSGSS